MKFFKLTLFFLVPSTYIGAMDNDQRQGNKLSVVESIASAHTLSARMNTVVMTLSCPVLLTKDSSSYFSVISKDLVKPIVMKAYEENIALVKNNSLDDLLQIMASAQIFDHKLLGRLLLERFGLEIINNSVGLQWAARFGHADCLRVLIATGADVNRLQIVTPLQEATSGNHINCVRVLLDAGADINKLNSTGTSTARDIAKQYEHLEILALLENTIPTRSQQHICQLF